MRRLQRLAGATLGVTLLLVAIGGFTRGTGSGFGCQDRWPLCEGGALGGLLPRWDFHMIVEWSHRWFAAISMILVISVVVVAWRRYRHHRALLAGATGALVVILAQAGLGAAVVMTHLDADLVATHLTVAMVVLALLAFTTVESSFVDDPTAVRSRHPDGAWRGLLGLTGGGILTTVVLGASVHDQYVGGWPLIAGGGDHERLLALIPEFPSTVVIVHFAHRVAALVTLLLLIWAAIAAVRRGRPRQETMLVHGGALLFVVNIGLGAAHVFTQVTSTALVVAHILVASLAWIAVVAAFSVARRADAGAGAIEPPVDPAGGRARPEPSEVRT